YVAPRLHNPPRILWTQEHDSQTAYEIEFPGHKRPEFKSAQTNFGRAGHFKSVNYSKSACFPSFERRFDFPKFFQLRVKLLADAMLRGGRTMLFGRQLTLVGQNKPHANIPFRWGETRQIPHKGHCTTLCSLAVRGK